MEATHITSSLLQGSKHIISPLLQGSTEDLDAQKPTRKDISVLRSTLTRQKIYNFFYIRFD